MKKILKILLSSITFLVAVYLFVIFTPWGSNIVTKNIVFLTIRPSHLSIEKSYGRLATGLIWENVNITDTRFSPTSEVISIQQAKISLPALFFLGPKITFSNGKLSIPGKHPILFYGRYTNYKFDINIFVQKIEETLLQDIFGLSIPQNTLFTLRTVDVNIKGPSSVSEMEIKGDVFIEHFSRKGIYLKKSPLKLALRVVHGHPVKIFGNILIQDGLFQYKSSAIIKNIHGRIEFQGSPSNLNLDIKAFSKIDDVQIKINLRGPLTSPRITLTSLPSFSQEALVWMLITNTKGNFRSIKDRQDIPLSLLGRQLLSYLFSSTGWNNFLQTLWNKNTSLDLPNKKGGVQLEKDLSPNFRAKYSAEASTEKKVEQKIGGKYKITDSISIEGEKNILPNEEKTGGEDKIILKFKKRF